MSPRRILATSRRVLTQVAHDHRTVGLLVIVPSILVGLVAWIFSDTEAFDAIGPAMLGLFPFIMMFVVTSITTLRERHGGTLERLLAMPIGRFEFIAGYALAFALLAAVQAAITVGFAVWVCGLEIDGAVWLLLSVAVVNGILGTSLGLLASAFARTEFQVVQFMPAIVFPQILVGGVFLPREDMPDVLHAISDWLPLSHAIDALNAVAGDTEDAGYVGAKLLILAAFIVGAIALGSVTLPRRTG